jgi:hypothetical protein
VASDSHKKIASVQSDVYREIDLIFGGLTEECRWLTKWVDDLIVPEVERPQSMIKSAYTSAKESRRGSPCKSGKRSVR